MARRFGVGELYGGDIETIPPSQVVELANSNYKDMPCPFKTPRPNGSQPRCGKPGGVCSLRAYTLDSNNKVSVEGEPVVTCPNRFLEGNIVTSWVGETLIDCSTPAIVSELPFLMGNVRLGDEKRAAGKIDQVLVKPNTLPLAWCALEMQAVYFSGDTMSKDLKELGDPGMQSLPFPAGRRRPDYRSSGPKRLMPQLQIKVPTISRWGKKMAVVIDASFWDSMSLLSTETEISNSEILWFIVRFVREEEKGFRIARGDIHYTTLSSAIEGLTGGRPVSLEQFERQILKKL